MNRGAARRKIFHLAADGLLFEQLLAEGNELHGVEVHAYCLMGNHFHLLVHCPNGGLSDFMHRVGSLYTRSVNSRTGGDGPIFRGRFRSLNVDSPEYIDRAGRYIHRNPLDIRPAVELDRYRWSSFRCYAGRDRTPTWLTTRVLIDMHEDPPRYSEFVRDDTPRGGPSGIDWAIDTVVAQVAEIDVDRRAGLRQTLAAALIANADSALVGELDRIVAAPSAGARRQALYRARKRVASDPAVAALVVEVLRAAA